MRDRRRRLAGVLATFAVLTPSIAFAQDAGASGDASVAVLPGPVDPNAPLPPGHPPTSPHGDAPVHRTSLPPVFAEETPGIPAGSVLVRVVDARGQAQPEVVVRLGAMRDGDREDAREMRTDGDGVARFQRLATGGDAAYRASVDRDGARFGAPPFQLGSAAGYRVQLVRHVVSHEPRAVLIWDARVELRFKDDRLVVVHRTRVANLSGMSLGEGDPNPVAFVPTDGLRFGMPEGATAFTSAPSMDDARITSEGGAVVFRGSVPPTSDTPMELVWQYHVPLSGGDVQIRPSLPLPLVNATVASEAPRGLGLVIEGFPPAELRESQGERILVTGLNRRPEDPPVRELRISLTGIPAAAGPERMVATLVAAASVLGALGVAVAKRRKGTGPRRPEEIAADRERVLSEMTELAKQHRDGEVGPETYARRRRELSHWLASLLEESASAAPTAD